MPEASSDVTAHEVLNNIDAMVFAIEQVRGGDVITADLLLELHNRLLSGTPLEEYGGRFREEQNWIGGTRPGNALFVPPPPDRLDECLDALERFLHSDDPALPPLIRAGMAHVQFETIHPFLDGNGRLGRLLITLILCEAGVLHAPILYLSLFLKSRRDDYYRLLQEVRQAGAWESWMEFFLSGIAQTAEQAAATARKLMELFDDHRQKIAGLGRSASSALRVHELMQESPIVTIKTVSDKLGISFPTAGAALENLAKIGIVREFTGRHRRRIYSYSDCLALLEQGTDPLPL